MTDASTGALGPPNLHVGSTACRSTLAPASSHGRVRAAKSPEERQHAMSKLALLKQMSFGAQVAEEELSEIATYFVETHQWAKMEKGDIDIVRGEKGAGKSAIYSLLLQKADEFFDKGILLVAAENPRGATVFRDLVTKPSLLNLIMRRLLKN
ncbi:MAG TPA: hypothetical protein VNY75_04080, partial [Rhizomicrobium sp.]|nr:hypothetical protein [Rhizomicrobium sp.]